MATASAPKHTQRAPIPRCVYHCCGCGAHFRGLNAFAAHRQDGACIPPSAATVSRGARAGLPTLQVFSDTGVCLLERGSYLDGRLKYGPRLPVVIWQRWGEPTEDGERAPWTP